MISFKKAEQYYVICSAFLIFQIDKYQIIIYAKSISGLKNINRGF